MNPTPKILITGANGFTGMHACKHFQETGMDVIAVVREQTKTSIPMPIEICDLTDKLGVTNLINKIKPDFILHLAGKNNVNNSWIDPVNSIEANMLSTLFIVETIRKLDLSCKMIVVGSALQFDPKSSPYPLHPYSLSKTLQVIIGSSWANLYNMDIVIAKPHNLIGPGHSNGVCSIFAQKIVAMEKGQSEKVIKINNDLIQRDFIDVRDMVTAYGYLINFGNSGEEYEIASGASESLGDVLEVFQSLSKVKFKIEILNKQTKEDPIKADISKISTFGWKPKYTLHTSLNDVLNYYRNRFVS
jgi:GDP-4-dehydro-6-deoxy-D-mannose reductase